MKTPIKAPTSLSFLIAASGSVLFALNATAEYRAFKNTAGKEISAQILEVQDSMVKLERKDKKTFKIKIGSLSEEDQDYIKKWAKENKSYGFKIVSKKKSGKIDGVDGHGHRIENKAQQYEVSVDHAHSEELENVEVHYKVFHRGEDPKIEKTTVKKIAAGDPYKFETKLTDKRLAGLWLRVYKDDKMIGEYQTNSPSVRKAEW